MRRVTLACVALFAFGCDHSWSLDVDTLIAERATDNRVIATVTVGCHENGESCPATYCVGVEWFAADNRKLDSANSCPDAPMEGTVALEDGTASGLRDLVERRVTDRREAAGSRRSDGLDRRRQRRRQHARQRDSAPRELTPPLT